MKNAAVYGFPGIRVRLLGLAEIYWPFLVFLIASGWLIGCILPVRLAPVPAAVVLFLSALMAWAASKRCEQRFSRFLKGAHGEEMVAHELATLPEGWVVIHGVPRAGILSGGSDFDHVVIAPGRRAGAARGARSGGDGAGSAPGELPRHRHRLLCGQRARQRCRTR